MGSAPSIEALHDAAEAGNLAKVQMLLRKGAAVNAKDDDLCTPLHCATCCSNSSVVKTLLDRGADKQAKDKRQGTPLHWAALKGDTAIVKTLLNSGADANITDLAGRTPLIVASILGHHDTAAALLEHSAANANAMDNAGKSALSIATELEHSQVKELLEAKLQGTSAGPSGARAQLPPADTGLVNLTFPKGSPYSRCQLRIAEEQLEKLEKTEQQLKKVKTDLWRTSTKLQQKEQEHEKTKEQLLERTTERDKERSKTDHLKQLSRGLQSGPRYNINPDSPGHLTIVGNINFQDGKRLGAQEDNNSLKRVFKGKLGFQITLKEDQTAEEMEEIVREIATDPKYAKFSCNVLVFHSHGDEDGILGVDGKQISEKFILQTLGDSHTLLKKPKLVFVQACRGLRRLKPVKEKKAAATQEVERCTDDDQEDGLDRRPPQLDMFCAHSTIPDYTAVLNRDKGSLFMQKLCDVLDRCADTMHVCDMMKTVIRELVHERPNEKKLSCPVISHNTFRNNFYFTRKNV